MATDIQLTEITDSTVFNSSDVMGNFNKLKLGITNVENGLSSLKLTDENIDVVAEDKKLSEVLPTVARKVETEALKARDIELQSAIDGIKQDISNIKQDIGGYAKRLETANNGIEARL